MELGSWGGPTQTTQATEGLRASRPAKVWLSLGMSPAPGSAPARPQPGHLISLALGPSTGPHLPLAPPSRWSWPREAGQPGRFPGDAQQGGASSGLGGAVVSRARSAPHPQGWGRVWQVQTVLGARGFSLGLFPHPFRGNRRGSSRRAIVTAKEAPGAQACWCEWRVARGTFAVASARRLLWAGRGSLTSRSHSPPPKAARASPCPQPPRAHLPRRASLPAKGPHQSRESTWA